jgi:hypothetical protein
MSRSLSLYIFPRWMFVFSNMCSFATSGDWIFHWMLSKISDNSPSIYLLTFFMRKSCCEFFPLSKMTFNWSTSGSTWLIQRLKMDFDIGGVETRNKRLLINRVNSTAATAKKSSRVICHLQISDKEESFMFMFHASVLQINLSSSRTSSLTSSKTDSNFTFITTNKHHWNYVEDIF